MALTGQFAARVLRSAIGVILHSDITLSEGDITRRVMANNVGPIPYRFQEYQGIVRQAVRIARAGTDVTFNGGGAIQARDLPVDPSIGANDAQFRYRALTEITDEDGNTVRTVSIVNSTSPLAYTDIRDRITDDLEGTASNRPSVRRSIAQLHDHDTVSVVIISAGKRA